MHCAKHLDALLYALRLPASFGNGQQSDTYSIANCNSNRDTNSNGDNHCYSDCDSYTYRNCYANAYCNPYINTDADPDTNSFCWSGSSLQF